MKFDKPPLTLEQQADLLISRGLIADKAALIQRLQAVNYYRLTAYLYPFRDKGNTFSTGTTLDLIWEHYVLDRQLRILTIDAIERVEVCVRTQIAYLHAHAYGPFGYIDLKTLAGLGKDEHGLWLVDLETELKRSREPFLKNFQTKYGDVHKMPPLWMVVEVMSFGRTLTLFRGIDRKMQQEISRMFGVSDEVFLSWLTALNGIRNICAHHGRLFDRDLGYQPKIPREQKYPQWHKPVSIDRRKIFGILTILRFLLRVAAPTSKWDQRMRALWIQHPNVSKSHWGFPANWQESPIWKTP